MERVAMETIPRLSYLLQRALVRIAREAQRLSKSVGMCGKHQIASALRIILCPVLSDSCIKVWIQWFLVVSSIPCFFYDVKMNNQFLFYYYFLQFLLLKYLYFILNLGITIINHNSMFFLKLHRLWRSVRFQKGILHCRFCHFTTGVKFMWVRVGIIKLFFLFNYYRVNLIFWSCNSWL